MARLWSSGFELNSTTAGVEWSNVFGSPAPTISQAQVHGGSYSLHVTQTSGTANYLFYQTHASAIVGPVYFRFYIYLAALPSAATSVFALTATNSTTTGKPIIKLNADGSFALFNGGSQIGSNSSTITTGGWHYVEMLINRGGGSGASILTARLDGSQFASSSTETLASNTVGITLGSNLGLEASTTGDFYFDDVAVNDNTLSSQNSWPGVGAIALLRPNAAGDNNQWLLSSGGAASTNNYTHVDEVTPDDASTTFDATPYLKRTATGTKIDDYNLAASASVGIGASDTITLVAVGIRMGATSSTSTNRTGILRIKGQASGTVLPSSSFGFNINGWATNSVATPRNYQLTAYTNPQTSTAWTPTTLDSMQIGFQNATSSTNEIRVTTVWALVEYIPFAVIPTTFAITHNTNSFLRKAVTKIHTTNSVLKKVFTKIHTTNSLLREAFTKTHTTDSWLHYTFLKTHTTDALLRGALTKTHTTDANLKGTLTKTHTTDALLHTEGTLTHDTDAYLNNALVVVTLEHTTDSLLRGVFSVYHGTYSTLKVSLETLSTTDALLRASPTKTHTTDALLKVSPELTHTTDALIKASPTLFHTTDSLLLKTVTLIHYTDAYLYHLTTFQISHTTDARLSIELFGAWSDTWDWIVVNLTVTHTTDALLRKAFTKTHTTDALLKQALTRFHTSDALLRSVNLLTHTTDSFLESSHIVQHSTDAFLSPRITSGTGIYLPLLGVG